MANNLTNPTDDQEKNDEAVDGTNAAVDESASSDVASDIDEDEQERMLILAQADQVKGMQLVLSENGEFSSEPELRAYALSEGPRDPERMYELYYKGIERLLRRFLPSGKGAAARKACEIVREEKSVYLTRGHRLDEKGIRGADSRMGHPEDAEDMLNLIIDWAITSGNTADLYMRLRDLNIRMGYGTPPNG
jgi:hypothetical protein